MKLALRMERETVNQKIPYQVIVEMWDKVDSGKHRRKYREEFTLKERQELSKWHTKFYSWYLIKGVPEFVFFLPADLVLINKAGNFFGSI